MSAGLVRYNGLKAGMSVTAHSGSKDICICGEFGCVEIGEGGTKESGDRGL